jgi:hypothetical protein
MSEQKKPSQVDAAVAAAAARRTAAAAQHPGVAQHVGMPGQQNAVAGRGEAFPTDEDDKPVYSVRQMERAMASRPGGGTGSLQTASFEALQRELQRRKDLAMGKLKDIPTEWLEMELQRRKEADSNG